MKVSIFLPRYILIIIGVLSTQRVSSEQKPRDSDFHENRIISREMRIDRERERERESKRIN